jgi:hypothetical protein
VANERRGVRAAVADDTQMPWRGGKAAAGEIKKTLLAASASGAVKLADLPRRAVQLPARVFANRHERIPFAQFAQHGLADGAPVDAAQAAAVGAHLAPQHQLPRLVRREDLKGDLHAHTTASDGRYTAIEMAEAAKARGYEYLAVTDHSQRMTVAHGLNTTRLRQQMRDIDRLLMEETGLNVVVAEDPLTCVARGGGRVLELIAKDERAIDAFAIE